MSYENKLKITDDYYLTFVWDLNDLDYCIVEQITDPAGHDVSNDVPGWIYEQMELVADKLLELFRQEGFISVDRPIDLETIDENFKLLVA